MAKLEIGDRRVYPRTKSYFGTYGAKYVLALTGIGSFMTGVVCVLDFFCSSSDNNNRSPRNNNNGGDNRRKRRQ